jgi:hypothetical protein
MRTRSSAGGATSARRAALRLATVPVIVIAVASCQPAQPAALETLGETVLQLGDAISMLQQENAILQEQMDSLRVAVAKQDTALRRFANLAGMPLP